MQNTSARYSSYNALRWVWQPSSQTRLLHVRWRPTSPRCLQYRGKQMMTPNPLVRPTVGFSMDLVRLYPERSPDLTARMEKMMRWFLHTVALNMDKDSRPVCVP